MRKTLGFVAVGTLVAQMFGCGSTPPPFNPHAMEQMQRSRALGWQQPPLQPLPTTLPAVIVNGEPVLPHVRMKPEPVGRIVHLSLREVIQRAVANSLDVRVAGYQPAIDEARILEQEAQYDPTFFSEFQLQRQFPQGVIPSNLNPNELYSASLRTGLQQKLLSGGQIEFGPTMTRSEFQQPIGIFNTALQRNVTWDSLWSVKLTQPLLQNFGEEVNTAQITIARNDQKISELDFRDKLETTIQTLEKDYWNLVFAVRDAEIQARQLVDTEQTLDVIVRRLARDATPLNVAQVRFYVYQRTLALLAARQQIGDLSDEIKRLMSDPDFPVASDITIIPADEPMEQPVLIDMADQIHTAMKNRFELMQQNIRISSARTVINAARNNMLPVLNMTGQLGLEGLDTSPRGAWDNTWETQLFSWAFGLRLEVPIGNRVARAIYERTLLQYQQAVEEFRRLADQVAMDVAQAQRAVTKSWEQMHAARQEVFAARDQVELIDKRLRGGEPLTAEFLNLKLQYQQQLAEAQRQEAQAATNYNIALSALEKAKGTLLRYNNILMKEEKGPASATIVPAKKKSK